VNLYDFRQNFQSLWLILKNKFIFTRESTRVRISVMTRKSPVTQSDIAAKIKVSRITVSKALRDHPDISAAMKEKVRKTAETMGYSPNLVAANLSQRKTNTIGVVIPDLENSFFAFLTDSIIDTVTERNYRIILTVSREKHDTEARNIRNLMGMRVDGLLVCISQTTTDGEIFDYAGKLGIPLVFFDRVLKRSDSGSVSFNDRQGTKEAIDKIVKSGYKRIAHFAGYSNISIGRERRNSFRSSLMIHGLPVEKKWIIEGGFETEDGYRAFEKLRLSGDMPELILAVNDRVALGAYRAAREAGLNIPGDIAVAGYGFSETTSMFNPPLAVINQDPRKLGVTAANLLVDEIEGKITKHSKILIDENFIFNESMKNNF
jgi:LacI family transcriptional regulator